MAVYTKLKSYCPVPSAKNKADRAAVESRIVEITRRVATAGADDETWAALWAGIDVTGGAWPADETGACTYDAARSALRVFMEVRGMAEDEAKAYATLYGRWLDLTLEQKRGLVRSLVRLTVKPAARGTDRIVVEPVGR